MREQRGGVRACAPEGTLDGQRLGRRGISISSTVLRFEWQGWLFNLVDAPGHADFSEDTYRTLWAVDVALMVVDGTRGLEPVSVDGERIVGVVGPLQLEVTSERMANEFGCPVRVDLAPYEIARWIEPDTVAVVPVRRGVLAVRDSADRHLLLFANRFAMERVEQDQPRLELLTEPPAG